MVLKAILAFALAWLVMPQDANMGMPSALSTNADSENGRLVVFDTLDRVRADLRANRHDNNGWRLKATGCMGISQFGDQRRPKTEKVQS